MTMMAIGVDSSEMIGDQKFQSELLDQLLPLRQALRGLLKEVGSPLTPTLLQRRLGAGYTICWQIYQIVRADNLAGNAQHAPSPASLKRLLLLAADRGVSNTVIQAVQSAAEKFDQFVQLNAEDRSAFDAMAAGNTVEKKAKQVFLQRRRAAYRAMSHLWGVQTDLYCGTAMMRRSASGTGNDNIWLAIQRGLRRLRIDAHLPVMGHYEHPGAPGSSNENPFVDHALDREAAIQYGMPILPAFSSNPLPKIETVLLENGWRIYNLATGEVGLRSNVECTVGYFTTNDPWKTDIDGRKIDYINFANDRKPVALVVLDLLLHRASFPNPTVDRMFFQFRDREDLPSVARAAQQFPFDERVTNEGRADRADLPEMPGYLELLQYASASQAWDLAEFDLYRLRVPYPIMGTATRILFFDNSHS